MITVVPDELALDTVSEAFQALSTDYRLSLPYIARVVVLEGGREAVAGAVSHRRGPNGSAERRRCGGRRHDRCCRLPSARAMVLHRLARRRGVPDALSDRPVDSLVMARYRRLPTPTNPTPAWRR